MELNVRTIVFLKQTEKDLRTKVYFNMVERIENETDEYELERLSNHKTSGIRLLVALNKNTNSKTLKFLSFDDKEEVRIAAKSNNNFISSKIKEVKKEVSIFNFIKSFFSRKELILN